ncbi:hypothetical protein NKR23_g12429 [Pleurostoma richardsiae]|uniref:Uncharacterized protein n=1 Tax=Pleurostoma richardsiae TaxID=41990 RepID=A0AA38VIH0_9PEZI|nr:hypothetical protein NKR23_g12429 [Pleurostoma richardsiae]
MPIHPPPALLSSSVLFSCTRGAKRKAPGVEPFSCKRPRTTARFLSPDDNVPVFSLVRVPGVNTTEALALARQSPKCGFRRTSDMRKRRRTVSSTLCLPYTPPFTLAVAVAGTIAFIKRGSTSPFKIHEDTPEQEMTNLPEASTSKLNIESDAEIEEDVEGCEKENMPPAATNERLVEAPQGPPVESDADILNAIRRRRRSCGTQTRGKLRSRRPRRTAPATAEQSGPRRRRVVNTAKTGGEAQMSTLNLDGSTFILALRPKSCSA